MILGVLSDSHNHLPAAKKALDLLMEGGAQHLVHCGDFGADVLDLIHATCLQHGIRAHVAIGNTDFFTGRSARHHVVPGQIDLAEYHSFELAGVACAVYHGHNQRRLLAILYEGSHSLVFTGHTHYRQDEEYGATRLLNPGSCARPRDSQASALLFNLATRRPVWINVQ